MLITAAAFWRPCFFSLSTLHHGLFVKDHISTDHHLVCLRIPQLETFHPFLMPQKDTLYRFCIKLRSLLTRNVHVWIKTSCYSTHPESCFSHVSGYFSPRGLLLE